MYYSIITDNSKRVIVRRISMDGKTEDVGSTDSFPAKMEEFVELANKLISKSFTATVVYKGSIRRFTQKNSAEFTRILGEIKDRIKIGWNNTPPDRFDFSVAIIE